MRVFGRRTAVVLAALSSIIGVQAQQNQGGEYCSIALCVYGIVTGNTVTWQLRSSLGSTQLGWMAIGFGSGMVNSPMVITWPTTDGSIVISQREASDHVMPTVVPNPPQVAQLNWANSILATNTTTISFTMPLPTAPLNAVPMIWAWSTNRPPSADPSAPLVQHQSMGTFTMDLTKAMNALPSGSAFSVIANPTTTRTVGIAPTASGAKATNPFGGSNSDTGRFNPDAVPLNSFERQKRTHGILMSVAFLVILPIGVFVARFSRTVPWLQGRWFTAHWVIQLVFAGPLIIAGYVLGEQNYFAIGPHSRAHARIGKALLSLWCIQVVWGAIIHFFKPKPQPLPPATGVDAERNASEVPLQPVSRPQDSPMSGSTLEPAGSPPHALGPNITGSTAAGAAPHNSKIPPALNPNYVPSQHPPQNRWPGVSGRPLQNYGHAINGLVIIALAFHNVREGYHFVWEETFGFVFEASKFLKEINSWWISWVIIIPSIYILGLTLLPRQWRLETDQRRRLWQEQHGIETSARPSL